MVVRISNFNRFKTKVIFNFPHITGVFKAKFYYYSTWYQVFQRRSFSDEKCMESIKVINKENGSITTIMEYIVTYSKFFLSLAMIDGNNGNQI